MSRKATPRRVAVFGATGRTGRLVVHEARARAWDVRVLVRDGSTTPSAWAGDGGVDVVVGDATDPGDVSRTVDGTDAVIDVLGHARGSPPDVRTRGMRGIIAAMPRAGVTRIVCLAGAGARQPGDHLRVVDRVFQRVVRLVKPDLFADNVASVVLLQASGLEWTVCRVSWLVDRGKGDLYVGPLGGAAKMRVSRADVAHWMVDEVAAAHHVRAAPVVAERT